MAFTVTARHSGTNGTTSSQTLTTDTVQPANNALLVLFGGKENDAHTQAQSWQAPNGGLLTYTDIATTAEFNWDGDASFATSGKAWRADTGVILTGFTITIDAYSTTNVALYNALACDITGHDTTTPVVKSATNGASLTPAGDSHSGTVTFASAAASGNLVLVYFAAGNDVSATYASPTAGAGKTFTQLFNQAGPACHGGLWYRVYDGTESNTITCSDLGQSVGNYAAIAVEIAAASGGSTPVSGSDSGTATETSAIATTLPSSDTGAVTESSQIGVPVSDSHTASETSSVSATASSTDSGTLTESSSIESRTTDTAALSETGTLSVTITSTDSATVTESQNLDVGGTPIAGSDTATITDATSSLSATGSTADTVGLSESGSIVVQITASDGITAAEAVALSGTLTVADVLALAEVSEVFDPASVFKASSTSTVTTPVTSTAAVTQPNASTSAVTQAATSTSAVA